MLRLQWLIYKKYLFLWFSLLVLINKKCASHFRREIANENKYLYLIHTWSDKALKGTVVNRALQSLHEGWVDIKYTAPSRCIYSPFKVYIQPLQSVYTSPSRCIYSSFNVYIQATAPSRCRYSPFKVYIRPLQGVYTAPPRCRYSPFKVYIRPLQGVYTAP